MFKHLFHICIVKFHSICSVLKENFFYPILKIPCSVTSEQGYVQNMVSRHTFKHKCATAKNCWYIICIYIYIYRLFSQFHSLLSWIHSYCYHFSVAASPYLVNFNEDWLFLVIDICSLKQYTLYPVKIW